MKYGVTDRLRAGLQVVLADGNRGPGAVRGLADVAGLSLTKLFVGSEERFGVITEVTLRLLPPTKPSHRRRDVSLTVTGRATPW